MSRPCSVFVDNMRVIHMLIQKVITFSFLYSDSVANSLSIAWTNYVYPDSSSHKKERYIQKVRKKNEQLALIASKKNVSLEELFRVLKQTVLLQYDEKKISSKFMKKLIQMIESTDNCSTLLDTLIDMYLELEENEKKRIKKKDCSFVSSPLQIVSKKENQTIQIFTDKNGYIYLNIGSLNGVMTLDKKSFAYENRLYDECFLHHQDFDIWSHLPGKLSPFEKRRKIFIQSMYALETNLLLLKKKEIDITYPVEKYFVYSKQILDYLYKEVLSFKEKNTVLDTLNEMTVSFYGCHRLLPIYDSLVKAFDSKIIDEVVGSEIMRTVHECKTQSAYVEFKNISHVVPTLEDIMELLNLRILKNIHIDFEKYFTNIEYNLTQVTQYMQVSEILQVYEEMKYVLSRSSISATRKMITRYKSLQATIAKILSNRLGISESAVIQQYLKEDLLY